VNDFLLLLLPPGVTTVIGPVTVPSRTRTVVPARVTRTPRTDPAEAHTTRNPEPFDATRGRSSAMVWLVAATWNPPGVRMRPFAPTTTPRRPVVPLHATSRYSAPSNATLGETSFEDDAE